MLAVFWDLLNGHEYLFLLAKALLPYSRKESEPKSAILVRSKKVRLFIEVHSMLLIVDRALRHLLHTIAPPGGYTEVERFSRTAVRSNWLHVMDGLLALDRATASQNLELREAVKTWKEFGVKLLIDDQQYRREIASQRSDVMDGVVGCSWLRCPLNDCDDAPFGRDMEQCSRCKAVRAVPLT